MSLNPLPEFLELKNPHSIWEALVRRPRDFKELRFHTEPHGIWRKIAEAAREKKIPVRDLPAPKQKHPAQSKGAGKQERTGHAVALVRPRQPVSLDKILSSVNDRSCKQPAVWLALDSLQDPHNVGAIFRIAGFFNLRGILLTKAHSAPVNATVHDISAGGVEVVPFAMEANLNRTLKEAQKAGLWVLGTSEHAQDSIWNVKAERPWLVVVGNEQKGLRRLTLEKCDQLCTIPGAGEVTSLNVTVATGIVVSALTKPGNPPRSKS